MNPEKILLAEGDKTSVLFLDKPLTKSMVGERIWKLREIDETRFWVELNQYVKRGFPGYTVVRVEYPIILLRDDRDTQKRKGGAK